MVSRLSVSAGLLALAATFGCARIAPPLTPPEAGGAQWRELVSSHVVLRTDRDEDDAREALTELERSYVALHDIGFPQVNIDGSRILVVHFNRRSDFERFVKAGLAGVFRRNMPNERYPEPNMLVVGTLDASARGTLIHELTHLFARVSLGEMPLWFNEGLAQYYQTLTLEDGYAYVGRPILDMRAWPQSAWRQERNGAFMTTLVPIGHVPSVEAMLGMEAETFYVWSDRNRQPTVDESKMQAARYLGAWGLVHMLMQDDKYQPYFDKLMEHVAESRTVNEAWAMTFADVDTGAMEADFRKHLLNKFETNVLRAPYKPAEVKPETDRAMSPAEVHLLWARLRPWAGADGDAARADLDKAHELDPGSAEILRTRGLLHIASGEVDEARPDIEAALAKRPDDERYLLAHLTLLVREKKAGRAVRDADWSKDVMRLEKAATSAVALDVLAGNWEEQDPEKALSFATRAVKADAACSACFATLGKLLFEKGDHPNALRATRTGLSLLPDGQRSDRLESLLAALRTAAARSGRPTAPEGGSASEGPTGGESPATPGD
ncbi:MAG: hypothetical protein R3B70_18600 [Polyangiaceae bacterium]